MPNIKSAKKRVKVTTAKNAQNKTAKSELKTAIKKFETAAAESDRDLTIGIYTEAVKKIDQAASRGILHKNTAARRKSRLARTLNKI